MSAFARVLEHARGGGRLSAEDVFALLEVDDLPALMEVAAELRDQGHGSIVSYSRKVFIPLTQLCRDLLPLLHLCASASARHSRLSQRRRSACDSEGGRRSGMPRSAFHARRQTGTALSSGSRSIGGVRSRNHDLLPRRHGGVGAGSLRPTAAPQCRCDERRGFGAAAARFGIAGADAGDGCCAPRR